MAQLKTAPTKKSVSAFLAGVEAERRKDCDTVLAIMKGATKAEPQMWGSSIVGFGSYHYKYESGREGDWFLTGFSPRKQDLTLYICSGFHGHPDLMERLGKYKMGKSCLYIKRLADVDVDVLEQLIKRSLSKAGAPKS